MRQPRLWDFVDEVQEQRSRSAEERARDEDEDWQGFFARLLELGFELPSDDDDDDVDDVQ